jgi:hypothetical protein
MISSEKSATSRDHALKQTPTSCETFFDTNALTHRQLMSAIFGLRRGALWVYDKPVISSSIRKAGVFLSAFRLWASVSVRASAPALAFIGFAVSRGASRRRNWRNEPIQDLQARSADRAPKRECLCAAAQLAAICRGAKFGWARRRNRRNEAIQDSQPCSADRRPMCEFSRPRMEQAALTLVTCADRQQDASIRDDQGRRPSLERARCRREKLARIDSSRQRAAHSSRVS